MKSTNFSKLVSKPSYNCSKVFSENLVAVHLFKDTLLLNRPIFVGMSILDLSKNLMYDFFYNQLKKQYPNLRLLYTDTDSFILHVETEDMYKNIEKFKDRYDTTNFSKGHFLFSNENKTVLGKFKDELAGIPIKEYIGIRSKMYSVVSKQDGIRKAKGIKKVSSKTNLRILAIMSACFIRKLSNIR